MASQTLRTEAILDTGILTAFLEVGRVDLLSDHPRCQFVITPHATEEIQRFFPKFSVQLNSEIQAGRIRYTSMGAEEELRIFAQLTEVKALGRGECACLATAIHRKMPLAMDDRVALRISAEMFGFKQTFGTREILVDGIRAGRVQIDAADELIQNLRVLGADLPFDSFMTIL